MSEDTSENGRRIVERGGSFSIEKVSKSIEIENWKSGKGVVEEPAMRKRGEFQVSDVPSFQMKEGRRKKEDAEQGEQGRRKRRVFDGNSHRQKLLRPFPSSSIPRSTTQQLQSSLQPSSRSSTLSHPPVDQTRRLHEEDSIRRSSSDFSNSIGKKGGIFGCRGGGEMGFGEILARGVEGGVGEVVVL